ncbi:MAG: alpha-amylase family protein, partial [Prevotella sp.]|nr:alpha-amylase family protein [Prevotella sp.]
MTSSKIIIYQVLPRLLGNKCLERKVNGTFEENGCGKMSFFDDSILQRIKALGITHIWYTGIIRHALTKDYSKFGIPKEHPAIVKGNAGSPYAIADYYDVDPDLADDVDRRISEFEELVKRTHKAGLKVIIDFVPNHVARQYKSVAKPKDIQDLAEKDDPNMGFSPQNNFYYCVGQRFEPSFDLYCGQAEPYVEFPAKATGNDRFDNHPEKNDWYETIKLNYGVDYCDFGGKSYHFDPIPNTWDRMTEILKFWASKGVDGFRCDMAEMVPKEFWAYSIEKIKRLHPNILFIGEVYNPGLYRVYLASGFDYLYDKVGMYDCLCGVMRGNCSAQMITQQWQNVNDILPHMLYFLENHDELRLASDFLTGNAYKGIPALIVESLMHQNPFMLYSGQEVGEKGMDAEGFSGQDGRTTIFDYWTVEGLYHEYIDRRKLTFKEKDLEKKYALILNIAKNEKAISKGEFFDLMYVNQDKPSFD